MASLLSCPNCSAVWSLEEIEDQSCGACGYPDDDDKEFDPDYIGPDPEDHEPDMNGPTQEELAERMHYYQRYLK